jgi:glycosyltransferase involved in cell wall biosynthesis
VSESRPPTVSVLLAVYNTRPYLAEAIESILAQSFEDFEFLIVDDGSTDGSTEVVRRFAGLDDRVRPILRENRGLVASLNEMIDAARGEFLARMDADDVALPLRLGQQVAFLGEHPEVVAAGSWVEWIDQEGDSLCEYRLEEDHEAIERLLIEAGTNSICHPAAMIRADAMRRVGGYRGEFTACEDYDLWLRLGEVGRLANMPEVLLKYRYRVTSKARLLEHDHWRFEDKAVRDACERRGLPASSPHHEASNPPRTEADHRMTWAWWALSGGNLKSARKNALLRLRRKPLSIESWKLLRSMIRGH